MKAKLIGLFIKHYGHQPNIRTFFSPGRVNLIGEHTDYNGGFVFPTALSIGNYGAIALRSDSLIRLYSENFPQYGIIEVQLNNLLYNPSHNWSNYVKGVILEIINQGYPINQGFDLIVYGDLPNSSGLSSSASIELLIAVMMNDLFKLKINRPDLAVLCKKVENEYIGVNCGIMDQFVIANGVKDHALLLDCHTLEFSKVPLDLGEYKIVICNSKVKRGLVDSKYNERRNECETSLKIFQKHLPITNLCDMTQSQFDTYKCELPNDVLLKRSRHAVTENLRAIAAVKQLKENDILAFGKAINQSHISLRDDYEVSCKELDTLVELALQNGSIGSRMTGAGFGGCTVNLVKETNLEHFTNAVLKGYEATYALQGEVYVAMPSDGTKEIK
ncbi:MAG: galactokinase [Tenericutes bacterium HGW-Tenericutes-1]|jgi:galactokinase|nr:MAG: galactokinase [Tenericutes bacterium HGW-Tenericutes-1]